jgi:hypothetical protein
VDHTCSWARRPCWTELMRGPYRIKTRDLQGEAQLPRPECPNQWRATMQKTALTIFAALLISGMTVQMAAASEHHRSKAYFGRDLSEFRRAYNSVNGPINVTLRAQDRFDRSVPTDPALNGSN